MDGGSYLKAVIRNQKGKAKWLRIREHFENHVKQKLLLAVLSKLNSPIAPKRG